MEEFLEMMHLLSADAPVAGGGNLLTGPDHDNDTDLGVYVENFKRQSPNRPPLGGSRVVTNVMVPGLPTPDPTDAFNKTVPWYLSRLCESTYETRLCDRQSTQNEPFSDNLAGQVTSKLNIPENASPLKIF